VSWTFRTPYLVHSKDDPHPAVPRPRFTPSIKRFRNYVLPLGAPAIPFVADLALPVELTDLQTAAS
jgi:hypothetical protein